MGAFIAPIPGGPVGSCFPCRMVRQYFVHYAKTSKETMIDTWLGWRCPGGIEPPVNCPSGDFVMSDDGIDCICKPGLYPFNSTHCNRCLKGHECPKGKLEKCAKHYHQPLEGQTECIPCADPATDDGFNQCTRRGQQLKMCDPAVANTQDQPLSSQCLPCNQCKRAYATSTDANLFSCYRDR